MLVYIYYFLVDEHKTACACAYFEFSGLFELFTVYDFKDHAVFVKYIIQCIILVSTNFSVYLTTNFKIK